MALLQCRKHTNSLKMTGTLQARKTRVMITVFD